MAARIFQRSKNAMQSGKARAGEWILQFESHRPLKPDPLMGWVGSGDTDMQVRLHFDTKEEAVAYAEREGIAYEVEEPKPIFFRPKSYADNFRFGRPENWTH